MTAQRRASSLPWLSVLDGPFNADATGTADSSAAFQLLVNTIAASGTNRVGYVPKGTYRVADVWMASNVALMIDSGVVFKLPPFANVTTTGPAVFRLLTVDRTLTTYLANIRLIGLGQVTIDYSDVPDGTYAQAPKGIHILNCQDFEIRNIDGLGIGSFAGLTISVGNNQSNTAAKHGRLENIGSHLVRGVGSACIQLQAGYDIEAVGLYADGGIPARMEADGNTGCLIDNCHFRLAELTNESGFANAAGDVEAHTNTIRNSSIREFVNETGIGNGVTMDYNPGGSVSGVRISDGRVGNGSKAIQARIVGLVGYPSFPYCVVERVNAFGCTAADQAFDASDGLTYKECVAYGGSSPGFGSVNTLGASQTPSPQAGSVCVLENCQSLLNAPYGVNALGVERIIIRGGEYHDTAARVATPLGSNLVTNSGFETNTTGWAAGTNTTIARVTTTSHTGSACLSITPTTTGSATAKALTGLSGIAVTANGVYRVGGFLKAGAGTARIMAMGVWWYDSSGVFINEKDALNQQTNSSTWIESFVVVTAPSNAAFATPIAVIRSPVVATTDVHYADDITFQDATGTATQTQGLYVGTGVTAMLDGIANLAPNATERFTGPGTVQEATFTTVIA